MLSSANEARIRDAAASLQSVLASLPAAPQVTDSGQPVAKQEEETAVADTETKADTAAPEPVEKAEAPAAAAPEAEPAAEPAPVAKAEGEGKTPMMVVYNQAGKLVGIADPADITPVANAEADAAEAPADEVPPAEPEALVDDTAPAPAAEAGIPADDVVKAEAAPGDPEASTPDFATSVAKSVTDALTSAFENQSATLKETIAKQATVIEGQAAELDAVKKRVEEIAEQPAAPKVFTNGATPPAGTVARPGPGLAARWMWRRRRS